jgi:tRNA U55 pseudouridine synthase TruB
MEGRLNEITIPTRTSHLYQISLDDFRTTTRSELVEIARTKIALLPTVTDPRKALGNDFRRPEVLASWDKLNEQGLPEDVFYLCDLTVTCSSGTYMRTLAEIIAEKLGTTGLALKIARTKIGHYDVANNEWSKLF